MVFGIFRWPPFHPPKNNKNPLDLEAELVYKRVIDATMKSRNNEDVPPDLVYKLLLDYLRVQRFKK